jgi:hypothetical protein
MQYKDKRSQSKMNKALYYIFLILSPLLVILGLAALIPNPEASWENVLGYKAICTLSPASTLFCFSLAGLFCFIRSTFIKDKEGKAISRFKKHAKSLIPVILLFFSALYFTYSFYELKAEYMDGLSEASAVKR